MPCRSAILYPPQQPVLTASTSGAAKAVAAPEQPCEYELERQRNIERNKMMMQKFLGAGMAGASPGKPAV